MKWGLSMIILSVRIGAIRDEQFSNGSMLVSTGNVEWSFTLAVNRINVTTALQKTQKIQKSP